MKTIRNAALLAVLGVTPLAHPQEAGCDPQSGIEFVCGPQNAEDLVAVPATNWIIASGMAPGSGLYLIDSRAAAWSALEPRVDHDAATFPGCAAAPDPATLITHGLNIRAGARRHSTLHVVAHGARESIEVYDVDARGARPTLTWKGCVPLPEGLAANSVASFADGSLVATVLFLPGTTFADAMNKKPTGAVFEWSPGDAGFELVQGSELPANNGIEVSADGREIFVASSGLQTIVAFAHSNPTRQLRTTGPLPFTPDNVHLAPDGRLLTAGMKNDVPECGGTPGPQHDLEKLAACPRPSIGLVVDPATMATTVLVETPKLSGFSNATMVLTTGDRYWFGTFSGNRIAHGTLR
ncbi:MAG TPA: hypothetical protein VIC71_10265 [Gammaproteobacteria bacterium]|jgi:hypothetical protein